MPQATQKVLVFIAVSVDGFIAYQDGDISFLDEFQLPNQDYGYADMMKNVGNIIIGANTYQKVLEFKEFPYQKPVHILTSNKNLSSSYSNVNFCYDSPKELIKKLKSEGSGDIFVDGGAKVIQSFLKENLVDSLILNIIPKILGSGISLFGTLEKQVKLQQETIQSYENGLVAINYQVLK